MKHLLCWVAGVALVSALVPPWAALAESVYWAESDGIRRGNLDGSGAEAVLSAWPEGLALDVVAGKVYWADNPPLGSPLPGRIRRADFSGTGDETLVAMMSYVVGIALDPAWGAFREGKVYWTDCAANDILRANLDGSGPETLLTKLSSPFGIALDMAGGKMYWTRCAVEPGTAAVERANLDGTGVEGLVKGQDGATTGIALDVADGMMYWGYVDPYIDSIYAGMIKRCRLDGSDVQTIVTGLFFPAGIALDTEGGKMYWTDSGRSLTEGTLRRANLDGTDLETLWTGLIAPRGIALDLTAVPEPGTLGLLALGGLGAIRRLRRRQRRPA